MEKQYSAEISPQTLDHLEKTHNIQNLTDIIEDAQRKEYQKYFNGYWDNLSFDQKNNRQ